MSTGFVWHERYMWHDTGTGAATLSAGGLLEPGEHAESPDSKRRLKNLLDVTGTTDLLVPIEPRSASRDELRVFHSDDYLTSFERLSADRGGSAGHHAPFGPGSYDIARLAAGGCIAAVDAVLAGAVDNAYALVRPPGHHALRDQGLGFCFLANVALAARRALDRGLERVAIVDTDVHHGNGTQAAFWTDPTVLTISLHQQRWFPADSGEVDERGDGAGHGANINVPLPAGAGEQVYLAAYDQVVAPALALFEPELIIVAAGYDASALDPLGRMLLTATSFRRLTERLLGSADKLCGSRLVMCHEGGYSAIYVPFCGLATIEALLGRAPTPDPFSTRFDVSLYHELRPEQAKAIRQAQSSLWALSDLCQRPLPAAVSSVRQSRASAPVEHDGGPDSLSDSSREDAIVSARNGRPTTDGDVVRQIERAATLIEPTFCDTPQFRVDQVADDLGLELIVKLETANPIRCFKGRGASYLLAPLADERTPLACASAGNFGQALAYVGTKHGLPVHVYASAQANPFKVVRMRALGATVELVDRDFDGAKELARQTSAERGWRFVEDGREPALEIGAGTIAVELMGEFADIDYVFVPVGNGALINGIGRWFKHASPATHIVGVGARGAPAMHDAWQSGDGELERAAETIADGIGARVPVPEAVATMRETVDRFMLVSDDDIVAAMRYLFFALGIVAEPAAAAPLAAIIVRADDLRGRRVALPISGSNLGPEQLSHWFGEGADQDRSAHRARTSATGDKR